MFVRRPLDNSMFRHTAPAFLLLLVLPGAARAADPLEVVRAFCRADGDGNRLSARSWGTVAPLVDWRLEPAWDRVYLIQGYEVGTQRTQGEDVVCEVKYTIVAEVPPNPSAPPRVESHAFRLTPEEPGESWRIVGPPPVPHVFTDRVDRESMAALLDSASAAYTNAAAFALLALNASGFDLPALDLDGLLESPSLQTVPTAEPGDVVLYLDAGRAYHVGVVDDEGEVASATLNAGIRSFPYDAFPGEIVYRRVVAAEGTPLATTAPVTTPTVETPD